MVRCRELDLGIRADADRQVVVIEAEAYREAEQIRGDGDAGSAAIYADAYRATASVNRNLWQPNRPMRSRVYHPNATIGKDFTGQCMRPCPSIAVGKPIEVGFN